MENTNEHYLGKVSDKEYGNHCVLIGHGAGADLTPDQNNVVIIGHDVRSLDQSEPHVFLGKYVAFSKPVWNAIAKVLEMPLEGSDYKQSNE